jgi:hypothetical protein
MNEKNKIEKSLGSTNCLFGPLMASFVPLRFLRHLLSCSKASRLCQLLGGLCGSFGSPYKITWVTLPLCSPANHEGGGFSLHMCSNKSTQFNEPTGLLPNLRCLHFQTLRAMKYETTKSAANKTFSKVQLSHNLASFSRHSKR